MPSVQATGHMTPNSPFSYSRNILANRLQEELRDGSKRPRSNTSRSSCSVSAQRSMASMRWLKPS
jgi:hypothetical protein